MATVVNPCLKVSVASVPDRLGEIVASFTAILASGEASDLDCANIRVAAAAVSGQLEGHPMIMGLAIQCSRMLDRKSRGIENMRGRRGQETARERELIGGRRRSAAGLASIQQRALQGVRDLCCFLECHGQARRKVVAAASISDHGSRDPLRQLYHNRSTI